MIKYFINATEQVALLAVLLGLICAYGRFACQKLSKSLLGAFSALGVVLTLIMTYLKINTTKIDTSMWNLRIFTAAEIAILLFFIFTLIYKFTKLKKIGNVVALVALSIYACLSIIYYGTPLCEYPHTIALSEDTLASSSFILKIVGLLLGAILALVMGFTAHRSSAVQTKKTSFAYLTAILIINTAKYIGTSCGILLTKRIVSSNHTLFTISKYTSNYSDWFIYAALVLLIVLQIVVLIQGATEKEPYTNPAERRKIIAKWRLRRRWAVTSVICIVLTVLTMTVISAYANKVVELSPIEDAIVENGNVYVAFDQVNDGALHRFGYEADDGTVIRFIVIKKPDSSSYGVGLDACDICGETGYYEKDGQVVCNLCDVVMNINTIGFKGGCNPIIIDWSIENGYIVVPIDSLLEHISEFQ